MAAVEGHWTKPQVTPCLLLHTKGTRTGLTAADESFLSAQASGVPIDQLLAAP
jgi:hypothetical protein